jgi:hypothetical protein
MHEHNEPDLDNDLLQQFAYESRDVEVDKRWGGFAVGFFAFFTVSVAIAWGFIALVDRTQAVPPELTSAEAHPMMPPTGVPLIQSDATASKDIQTLRQAEDRALTRPNWTDDKNFPAHIPIDDAERIILQRGLPTRANPVEPKEAQQ